MNRLITILIITVLIASCGENHALKEETFKFDEENKGWVNIGPARLSFMMRDSNNISYGFSQVNSDYYFGKSWSSFLGITTHISLTEYNYQKFISNYGIEFSLSLTAGFPPFGDALYVEMDDIGFSYDLAYETISRVNVFSLGKSLIMTDEGYEADEEIISAAQVLDNLEVGGTVYQKVLFFRLEDFTEELYRYSVREIYIARDVGLVKYVLNSGLEITRTNNL